MMDVIDPYLIAFVAAGIVTIAFLAPLGAAPSDEAVEDHRVPRDRPRREALR
jgi:hypothetical protein